MTERASHTGPASPDAATLPEGSARAGGFRRPPVPRAIGNANLGKRVLDDPSLREDGFGWLDDLAALGTPQARSGAQQAVMDWIAAHPRVPDSLPRPGQAPEWQPEITGRRVRAWIFHSGAILPGLDRQGAQPFFDSIDAQLNLLAVSHGRADPGLPQIEALSALVIGAMLLRGAEDHLEPALTALSRACARGMPDGAIQARNPEALLAAFADLGWVIETAAELGQDLPRDITDAMTRMAPVLRTLRHADGTLPRFHGGGRGAPGRLDHMLRHVRLQPGRGPDMAMGFSRLARARTTVILDAAPPPSGVDAARAHASTLAFEMTVARHPMVISCGPGASFGPAWARASRATPCHSTLCLAGTSSSRLMPPDEDGAERLTHTPRKAWAGLCGPDGNLLEPDEPAPHPGQPMRVLAGHDGWGPTHGLTHLRELWLSPGGDNLQGEDTLAALDLPARARLETVLAEEGQLPFDIRFHLHPEIDVRADGDTFRLTLPGGDEWYFSHDLIAHARLEPSAWMERGAPEPVATTQIVLSHVLEAHAIAIGWTFMRAGVR